MMEIIIVIFLIALASALVFGAGMGQMGSVRLKADARKVHALLRLSRDYALMDARENECLYDPETRELRESRRGKRVRLDSMVELYVVGEPVPTEPEPVVTFHADGAAEPAVLRLTDGERSLYLVVDPLLGEVEITEQNATEAL